MNRGLLAATLIVLVGAASAQAEQRLPSTSKLAKLGLASMQVASDAQGSQVRGEGVGILGTRLFSMAFTVVAQARGGTTTGPASPTFGNIGTFNPVTGINSPFTANFTSTGGGNSVVITASTSGFSQGFAN